MTEIYVSTDVETDGPIPGPHSMLSFASAAFLPDKTLLGTFAANLHAPSRRRRRSTDDGLVAGAAGRLGSLPPECPRSGRSDAGVRRLDRILTGPPRVRQLPGRLRFPVRLLVYDPVRRQKPVLVLGIDIKTYAMALLNVEYRRAAKRNMPRRWFDDLPHTHVAHDDALGRGAVLQYAGRAAERTFIIVGSGIGTLSRWTGHLRQRNTDLRGSGFMRSKLWWRSAAGSAIIVLLFASRGTRRALAKPPARDEDSGQIIVRVLDDADKPQAGAGVSLFAEDESSRAIIAAKRDMLTDSSGIARFDRLRTQRTYKLRATTDNHLVGYREFTVLGDEPRREIDLHVSRPAVATIHVNDTNGKPIAGATIWCVGIIGKNGSIGFVWQDLKSYGMAVKASDSGPNHSTAIAAREVVFRIGSPRFRSRQDGKLDHSTRRNRGCASHDARRGRNHARIRIARGARRRSMGCKFDSCAMHSVFHPSTLFGQLPRLGRDGDGPDHCRRRQVQVTASVASRLHHHPRLLCLRRTVRIVGR